MEHRKRAFLAEDNLMFAARLGSVLRQAGYEVQVFEGTLPEAVECDVMVVHLGARGFRVGEAAARARAAGARIIGHAGGREADLMALGKQIGCDRILSNSQAMAGIVEAVRELCER